MTRIGICVVQPLVCACCGDQSMQALALDMRSSYRGRGSRDTDSTVYRWDFDGVTVSWTLRDGTIVVTAIEKAAAESARRSKPRQKKQ